MAMPGSNRDREQDKFKDTVQGTAVKVSVVEGGGGSSETSVYAIRVDKVGSITYYGFALPGSLNADAVWQIKRLQETGGGDSNLTFADGNSNFDNIWNNRTLLTYS